MAKRNKIEVSIGEYIKRLYLYTTKEIDMRTMRALKVYEWLLANQMFVAAPALVNKFGLAGNLEYDEIEKFLAEHFRNPSSVFRRIQCDVSTSLTIEPQNN